MECCLLLQAIYACKIIRRYLFLRALVLSHLCAMLHYVGESWCLQNHVHSPQDASRAEDAMRVSLKTMPVNEWLSTEPIFMLNVHRWSCREVLFRNLFVFGAVFIAYISLNH